MMFVEIYGCLICLYCICVKVLVEKMKLELFDFDFKFVNMFEEGIIKEDLVLCVGKLVEIVL